MLFQSAVQAIALLCMDMICLCAAANGCGLRNDSFKASICVYVNLGNGFCADKNRFCGLCGFRLAFFHTAADDGFPIVAVITVGMTGIFRDEAGQLGLITGIGMDMILRNFADKPGFRTVTCIAVGMDFPLLLAAVQNRCIAASAVAVVFRDGADGDSCIACFVVNMAFLFVLTGQIQFKAFFTVDMVCTVVQTRSPAV